MTTQPEQDQPIYQPLPQANGPVPPASEGPQAYEPVQQARDWSAPPPGYDVPQYFGAPPPPPAAPPPPPSAPPPGRHGRRAAAIGVSALVAVAAVAGIALAVNPTDTVNGTAAASGQPAPTRPNGYGNFPFGNQAPDSGNANPGNGGGTGGNGGGSGTSTGQKATSAQQAGIVDINTVLSYQSAQAAGTGMVLSPDGEILTNNHVVEGATSISVTVVTTGKIYTATVVGTNPTGDIAVLKLQNASGLTVANLGDSSTLKVGDTVIGVGNAGGTGGVPSAATGTVTALNRTITASDEGGQGAERLKNVIVTNAAIQAGDSGGPLYTSKGKVVGMDTAAGQTGETAGFAIPINNALLVVKQIESGVQTSAIHIGYPGFLGVTVSASTTGGAGIDQVLAGGPAAKVGIVGGDVITAVGNTTVTSPATLKSAISVHKPGQSVKVSFTDAAGQTHRVSVTLATGPAD